MKQNIDVADMQDRHLDIMIKLAFDMDDADEVQRIASTPDPILSEEDEVFSNSILEKAFIRSENQRKKEQRAHYADQARKLVPRIIEIAACLVLIVAIAMPVALATSAAFRAKVMHLLMEMDSEKGAAYFSFTEDKNASFWVPEGWQGTHYPSYIPDGFLMNEFDPFFTMVEYRNDQNDLFYFIENNENSDMMAGTDNSTVSSITINGHPGFLIDGVTSDGITHTTTVVWQNDTKWFSITSFGLSSNEVMTIATRVKEIIK